MILRWRRRGPRLVTAADAPVSSAAAREARLRRVTAVILAVGLATAVALFFRPGAVADNPLGYDPLETKSFRHDLELYGGEANVLAAEFREWFAGLWHGRNLAYTVAVLTILLVLGIRSVDRLLAPLEPDDEDDGGPPERPA